VAADASVLRFATLGLSKADELCMYIGSKFGYYVFLLSRMRRADANAQRNGLSRLRRECAKRPDESAKREHGANDLAERSFGEDMRVLEAWVADLPLAAMTPEEVAQHICGRLIETPESFASAGCLALALAHMVQRSCASERFGKAIRPPDLTATPPSPSPEDEGRSEGRPPPHARARLWGFFFPPRSPPPLL
jgi:hypothetical protein